MRFFDIKHGTCTLVIDWSSQSAILCAPKLRCFEVNALFSLGSPMVNAGKEVHVNMEYSRKVGGLQNGTANGNPAPTAERQMDFGSIHIKEKAEKNQHKMTNVRPF